MKSLLKGKLLAVIVFMMLLALITACTSTDVANENTTASDVENTTASDVMDVDWEFYSDRAKAFITATASGDFDIAADMFSEAVLQEFGVEDLQEAWEEIIGVAGEFIEIDEIENAMMDGYFISSVIMRHESFGFVWNIIFLEDGIVSGLSTGGTILLSDLTVNNELAATVEQRDGFTDYPIIVGEETDFPLAGILSMPDNITGQVPAVVLVHGSGASDMNGVPAIAPGSPNQLFRDIAEYLAANGIAVIRYDKRTLTHVENSPHGFTVWEETIEDAILAADILRVDPRIDEDRVFILGHSLGGMLAPRIHVEGGDFAGLILFAGSPRFLLDISLTQNMMTIEAMVADMEEGDEKDALLSAIEIAPTELNEQISWMLDLSDEEARNTSLPGWGGVSVYYFVDLYRNPVSDLIENITIPILVMQPGNDLQVLADVDFVLYQELLEDRTNVTFKLYEGLNHFFMPATAENILEVMDEHAVLGNVDGQVLADIVEWIKDQ